MDTAKSSVPGTRQRIVNATAELFGHCGYTGTGLKAILEASRAPYGSLYHFFPGGKEELGAEALRTAGAIYRQLVEAIYGEGVDVVAATQIFFQGAALVVETSDFADACPIAIVALEVASSSTPMRQAAAEVFESWLTVLEGRLVAAGVGHTRARELAVELFCAIEGAFLLSRTIRSTEPIDIAGRAATAAVAAACRAVDNISDRRPPGPAGPAGSSRRARRAAD